MKTLERRGLFQDKSQVAGLQRWRGTNPCKATSPKGIFLALSFNYLDSSLLPKGYHHLQRTYSNYPGKQSNWDFIALFICSMLRMKTYPKQEQKVTRESIPLSIGKTVNNLWSHRLSETIVGFESLINALKIFSSDKCPGEK